MEGDFALLNVRVQPRSSREKAELSDEGVKVWVTAPPVDGSANEAVQHVLAETLGLKRSAICLVKGHQSRSKVFRVEGLSLAEVRIIIEKAGG
jgi:uncharacterized protein